MVFSNEGRNTRREKAKITSVGSCRFRSGSTDSGESTKTPAFTRTIVQHCYRDHSMDPVIPGHLTSSPSLVSLDSISSKATNMIQLCNIAERFPEQLFQMLKSVDADNLGHIVSWQPHGRCFVVHKRNEFVQDVMPKYFRQSRFTSFQRQLNLYGFHRLTVGTDRGGYYHEFFLRGRPDLCKRIARMRIKGTGTKPAPSPETEPNFYSMVPCMERSVLVYHQVTPTEHPTFPISSFVMPAVAPTMLFEDEAMSNEASVSSTHRSVHERTVESTVEIDSEADELPLLENNVADVDPATLEVFEADFLPPDHFNKCVDPVLLTMLLDGGLFQSV